MLSGEGSFLLKWVKSIFPSSLWNQNGKKCCGWEFFVFICRENCVIKSEVQLKWRFINLMHIIRDLCNPGYYSLPLVMKFEISCCEVIWMKNGGWKFCLTSQQNNLKKEVLGEFLEGNFKILATSFNRKILSSHLLWTKGTWHFSESQETSQVIWASNFSSLKVTHAHFVTT